LLRAGDRDRWLATLFAPTRMRAPLHALYAFSLEIARVREIVSDPLPGEIRFQWWRDALEGEGRGDVEAHPVAHALIDTMRRFGLPRQALTNLVDARTFDLYDDPMPGLRQFEGYCGETSSALLRLAAMILAGGMEPGGADAAGYGGIAYAIVGLLRALPWHAARGQVYLPRDVLDRHGATREEILAGRPSAALRGALAEMRALARERLGWAIAAMKDVAPASRAAFLPLALIEPYLARMERSGYDPFRSLVELAQWRRQWALWRGAWRFG
jgi:phytoene synthase